MAASKNYPKEFVENTIKILNQLDEPARNIKLEVTFFMNCLLGLIVTTLENIERKKELGLNTDGFKIKLKDPNIVNKIPKKIKVLKSRSFKNEISEKVREIKFLKNLELLQTNISSINIQFLTHQEVLNNELIWLLKKLRNGIAHQHIMPTSENKEWKGIRIYNYNNGIKDFAIEFTIAELREFSKMIAKKYLDCFKKEKS